MFDTLIGAPFFLTLKVSLLCIVLQLFVGVPLGLYIAGKKTLLRQIVDVAISLPMIFPPMALGFFLLLMVGKNGFIGKVIMALFDLKIIFSFWGVLIAVFVVGLPFMVKSVQSARHQLHTSIIEAAQTLGKSNFVIVWRIIMPNIKQGILTGLLLSFGRSLGEVGISLMLGGNIIGRTETMSLAIYNAVFEGNYTLATQLSIFLSILATAILMLINLGSKEIKKPNLNRFALGYSIDKIKKLNHKRKLQCNKRVL